MRWRSGGGLLLVGRVLSTGVALAAGALGVCAWAALGVQRAPAGAVARGTTPGSVILSVCFPGFVVAPDGIFNGPISSTTLASNTEDSQLLTEIAEGAVNGYLRTWGQTYPDGMGIVSDLVLQFPNPAQVTAALENLEFAMIGQFNATTSVAAAPKNAIGYATTGQVVPGSTDYAVGFGRGDFASFVLAATPDGNVTAAQVEYMADAQWNALPATVVPAPAGTPGAVPGGVDGGLAGGVAGGVPAPVPAAVPSALYPALPSTTLSSPSAGGLLAVVVLGLLLMLILVVVVVAVAVVVAVVGRQRRGPDTAPS